ncbi:AMIN domain-containing protein [Lysobacter alkalisoli]|uniref:N-acetylmuramoyl-L-alanine amidase AmiC n=2 Tax=Marilutibacter alkalisoli TaxID=2591633 RepID=A0A514BWH2_9GAMM|nr:AMIN domain-containing protein [Lysobacter alkalisoli]
MALLGALAWNLAHASQINDLQLSSGATGTRAEILLDTEGEIRTLSLSGPDRLVVDLPGSQLARNLRLPAGAGVVKAVRTGQPVPGTTRIVFDLAQPVAVLKPRLEPGAKGPTLVLEWPDDGAPVASQSAATPVTPASATPVQHTPAQDTPAQAVPATTQGAPGPATVNDAAGAQANIDAAASAAATTRLISELAAKAATAERQAQTPAAAAPSAVPPPTLASADPATRPPLPVTPAPATSGQPQGLPRGGPMRPLIIAIDAGHGGQDPGAIGPNGKREKDVTLAIARELARQVNATPGLKAYLTRDSDVFIPLHRRTQLARQAKADMFVSIHADAAENRNAKGSSVYVLSLKGASSQRARWLADKENASDLIGGVRLEQTNSTLANVLLDLTQSGQMRASEDAAIQVLNGLKRIGNNHKPNIERANFAVLRTSDMPAMLVETAFISNADEERRLIDPAFQRQLARAMLDGVNTYFVRQPPPGTLYAARASADSGGGGDTGGAGGSP